MKKNPKNYIEAAQNRAMRRKSKWNLLLFAIFFLLWMFLAFFIIDWVKLLHQHFYPDQSMIKNKGLSELAGCSLVILALPLAFIGANVCVWIIPPARHALDLEAKPHHGTDFLSAQRGLLKMFAYMALPCLLLAAVGLLLPW